MGSFWSLDAVRGKSHRRRDIQGLRAVSVLMVLAFHAGLYVPGGFVGVDVFFVISGFVITAMLHREWISTQRIRFREFYLKRFLRLTPALAVMVAFTVIVSSLLLSPFGAQQTTATTAAGSLLLAANYAIASTTGGYFDGPASGNPLLNTWSLSVEEQFYLIFPAILAAGWFLSRKRNFLRNSTFLLVAALTGASFLLAMKGPDLFGADAWLSGFYSPLTRAWEFGVGSILALIVTRLTLTSKALASTLGVAGAAMLIASLWLITETTPFPGKWTILPVAGALLLLLAGTHESSLTSRALSTKPMVKIGDWSYSIYLWHWPFIVFATVLWPGSLAAMVIACLVSILPALASYRWVETPFRNARGLSRPKFLSLAAMTVAVPLALAGSLSVAADNGYWNDRITNLQAGQDPVAGIPGCFTDEFSVLNRPTDCLLNEQASGDPVYLVGDSNAYMFTSGVLAASESSDRPFISYTFSACPLIGGVATLADTGDVYRSGCDKYQETALSWLHDSAPGTVVLGSADYYLRDPSMGLQFDSDQVTGTDEKIAAYANGLKATVATLRADGHHVVVVIPIPNFRLSGDAESAASWEGPQACTNIALLLDSCSSNMDSSLTSIAERQGKVWDAVEQAAAESGADVLDLSDAICHDNTCSIMRDGTPVYADYNHISTREAATLAPEFAGVLR